VRDTPYHLIRGNVRTWAEEHQPRQEDLRQTIRQTTAAITGSAQEDRQDRLGDFLCGSGDANACAVRRISVCLGWLTKDLMWPETDLGREWLEPHQACARSAFFYDPVRKCAKSARKTLLDPRIFC
jgi:hypothetical protein